MLLFTLEPLTGRLLLPHFGGAFHVWTTSLMFFQGALFLAYLYAHLLADRLGKYHLLVVLLPLLLLPPGVGGDGSGGAGLLAVVTRLTLHIGLPFTVLASTAIVAQRWVATTWTSDVAAGEQATPYGLYAVSNAGSLGALLAYALVVEPLLGVQAQRWIWTSGYVLYVVLAVLAWRARAPERPKSADHLPEPTRQEAAPAPAARRLLYWGALSASTSAFLMAVTNSIALDAGNVPLVWVVPLAIYLASFVVAFATPMQGEESRVPGLVRRLWPHVAAVGLFFYSGGDTGGGWFSAAVHLAVLAFVSGAAHAEIYRDRPDVTHLTTFYLVIALGGWIGGAAVAVLAPSVFSGLFEYPLALCALTVTMVAGRWAELKTWLTRGPKFALLVSAALLVVIVVKVGAGASEQDRSQTLEVRRSFYGIYQVTRTARGQGAVRDLVSGNTRHGRQREGDDTPLSYYHPDGPLGDALSAFHPTRIGAVGLGVGAAAGHLTAGQSMRFFEIDPVVVQLARAHFTYLGDTEGEVEVVVGDARVRLEMEQAAQEPLYDLLLIDAFAGDAIPAHLLTVEALRLYMDRVVDDGVVLLHVSNRYYDLRPVLRAAASGLGFASLQRADTGQLALDQDPSQYVALARREPTLAPLVAKGWSSLEAVGHPNARAWTDDHINTLSALIW
ncbi:MAG TPA: hypothetical protein ENK57_10160 [Polyangiaceae bacterium]|nr:hypothetical protein [Polyangiaceae bacterium]